MDLSIMVLRRSWYPLAGILLLAAALRVWMLGRESLWLDEVASLGFASGDLAKAIRSEATNPPLYYVLLHFWVSWFGATETALRSLSVIPSVTCIWVLYRFGKETVGRAVALLAAGYQAVSTFHIYYAQEARAFSFLTLFVISSAYFLWKAIEEDSTKRRVTYYLGHAVFLCLALYTHFIAILSLPAFWGYVVLRRKSRILGATLSQAVALLLFSPWLITMLNTAGGGGQSRRYLLLKPAQAVFSFLFGDTLIPLDEQAVRNVTGVLLENWWKAAAALAVFGFFAWRSWMARRRYGDALLYMVGLTTIPLVLGFFISFKVMLFDERYFIFTSPFLYLIVSTGAWESFSTLGVASHLVRQTLPGWVVTIAYLGLLTSSLYNYYFNPRFGKEQWREVVQYIESANLGSERSLIIFDPDYIKSCYNYYSSREVRTLGVTVELRRDLERSPGSIAHYVLDSSRVWLIRAHSDSETALRSLRSVYVEAGKRSFPKAKGIEVYRFERRRFGDE